MRDKTFYKRFLKRIGKSKSKPTKWNYLKHLHKRMDKYRTYLGSRFNKTNSKGVSK